MPKSKTAPADEVEIVFVNHTADHLPGDRVTVATAEARRLVKGHAARYATDDEPAEPAPTS